jgi:hypothetical protein
MRPSSRITEDKIAAFVDVMRTNVLSGETPFRRVYIRSMINQVEVDDPEIRIIGRRTVLERLVMGGGAVPAGVPSFVRKRRARRDSNGSPFLSGRALDPPSIRRLSLDALRAFASQGVFVSRRPVDRGVRVRQLACHAGELGGWGLPVCRVNPLRTPLVSPRGNPAAPPSGHPKKSNQQSSAGRRKR